jgi:hypothetical protein
VKNGKVIGQVELDIGPDVHRAGRCCARKTARCWTASANAAAL